MTDYTPTTEQVRRWADLGSIHLDEGRGEEDFDRWLAEHDRQVAARAWEECLRADTCTKCGDCHNPYDVEDRCSLESSRCRELDEVARVSREADLYDGDEF